MNHYFQILLAAIVVCALPFDRSFAEEETRPKNAAGEFEAAPHPKTIRWSYLAPENGKPFNDPFSKLTQNQLSDLSYVVRVQRLIAQEKIKADGVDAKEAAELARKLKNEGVDIDWLMVQRERVRQIRGMQVEGLSKSIAKSLGDKQVTLTGYVIPIKTIEGRLTEFFLVPTSAVCSNEAAPSPLQVIFISTEPGIARPGIRIPVRVTGTVQAKTTKKSVRNGVAVTTIQSAYTMLQPEIKAYAQRGN
ncbi:hypothetical protein CA54_21700 [Symmachiella macrocystis]|uniref:DUF3299 domain-containing protein n=1 Tax=Symmachiella macrocystis TaxID=2527985 RepID=A0A5C6BMT7_9PLAN|nr:DUF3299 domain-containing protein [Symmachiella macrocystis]TWU13335.1 hypothetical protein CA54_21700 [Symmachiella macrocystis]